jgi:hypothetical protein
MELKDLEALKADPKWTGVLGFVSDLKDEAEVLKTERDTLDRKNQFYEAFTSAQTDLITSLRIGSKALHDLAQSKLNELTQVQVSGADNGIPTRSEQVRMMMSSVDNSMTRVNAVLQELVSELKRFNPK